MQPRLAKSVRNALLGGSLAVMAVTMVPPTTVAADPPLTVAEAKQQVDELNIQAAAIDQDYAGVQDKISKGRTALATKQSDVRVQKVRVAHIKKLVGQVALANFQNRSIDQTAQLFLRSDTQDFLNQVSTVENVNQNQNSALQSLQREQGTLTMLEKSAATDLATLQTDQQSLAGLRSKSDAKVAQAKKVLATLTAEERARLAAQERAKAKAAARAAAAADAGATTTGTAPSNAVSEGSGTVSEVPAGSSKGASALAWAKTQVGKPYSFGATGPNAYDCSGLTGAAWAHVGVSIPRTSQTQYSTGAAVSKDDLQPGDLIFYYSGISHVALYAGNGQILHASRPGKPVGYADLNEMPFMGARRPG